MRYKQLLVAVHSGVVGAEIWVLAQVQLDKQIDIPPAATAICCGSVDEEQLMALNSTPAAAVGDLLRLAFQCASQTAASRRAGILFPLLPDSSLIPQLLLTAIRRQHTNTLPIVLQLPAVWQLPAEHIAMLMQAVVECAPPARLDSLWLLHHMRPWEDIMQRLAGFPDAAAMAVGQIVAVFQRAVERCLQGLAATLLQCKNLQNTVHFTGVADIICMLQLAAKTQQSRTLEALSRLTAAQHVAPELLADLMITVCQAAYGDTATQRRAITAAAAAAEHPLYHALRVLCGFPAAEHMPKLLLQQVAQTAVAIVPGSFPVMCSFHSAMRDMDIYSLLELIEVHQQYNKEDTKTLIELLQLPAAKYIPAGVTVRLITHAIEQRNTGLVWQMCQLSSARMNLDGYNVLDVLNAAVQIDRIGCGMVEHLCELTAAEKLLPVAAMEGLLRSAVEHHNGSSIMILCRLGAAKQLSRGQVAGLIEYAEQQGGGEGAVEALRALLPAGN